MQASALAWLGVSGAMTTGDSITPLAHSTESIIELMHTEHHTSVCTSSSSSAVKILALYHYFYLYNTIITNIAHLIMVFNPQLVRAGQLQIKCHADIILLVMVLMRCCLDCFVRMNITCVIVLIRCE